MMPARWMLLVLAPSGCGFAQVPAPVVDAAPLVVDVAPSELLVRPRIWANDERRRDAPAGVERWHVYRLERSAISSSPEVFPSDGAMLFAFAGVELERDAGYAVIDDTGFVGVAVATGDRCPPGQRADLPCTFGTDVHGYARIEPAPKAVGDGAIAIGPLRASPPTRARLTRNLGEPTQIGPCPAPASELTLDLVDLDGDGSADLATTLTPIGKRACGGVVETLVRFDDGWFAVEWDAPECAPSDAWTTWLVGFSAVDREWIGRWVGDPRVGERFLLLDSRGVVGELERAPYRAGGDEHGRMLPVRALRSPIRKPGAVAIAIGPSEPSERARLVGGLFTRPRRGGFSVSLGDAVLYQVDLDGDRRSDLEARSRACWIADIYAAHGAMCVEIVRREGSDWRVIARAMERLGGRDGPTGAVLR